MEKSLRDQIMVCAGEARLWTEDLAAQRNKEAHYIEYDREKETLAGYCAIASSYLWKLLNKENIEASIWISTQSWCDHVFVVVEDHIVDITATQFPEFENQEIVLMHIKEAEQYNFYADSEIFHTALDLVTYQKKNRWPSHQRAFV